MPLLSRLRALTTRVGSPRVGKYRVLRRLAEGGMGEIDLARSVARGGFEKLVVLKRLRSESGRDRDAVRMFLDEARLMAALNHPNIVQVYDFGTTGRTPFFAMEHVHGQDLGRIVEVAAATGRALTLEFVVGVIAEAAAGLHYAHEQRAADGSPLSIVHRDVSPSNVLVSYEGAVKVADFGIAKWSKRQTETRYGALRGKIAYMSPEQGRGQPLDRRSDVFGLGILLYELLTGTRLFQGASDYAILEQIVMRDAPAPSLRRPGLPPELEAIALRALARDPARRFPTARDLQLELEELAYQQRWKVSAVARAEEMESLFRHEIGAWRQAAEAGRTLGEHLVAVLPERTRDLDGEGAPRSHTVTRDEVDRAPASAPSSRRGLWLGSAVGVLGVAGAVTWWTVGQSPGAPPATLTSVPAATSPATQAPAAPPALREAPPATRTSAAPTRSRRSRTRTPTPARAPVSPPQAPGQSGAPDKKKIWDPDSIFLP